MAKKNTVKSKEGLMEISSSSGIAYKGSVRIQLLKGDRVYRTIEQHNVGTAELFRYLANALAGNVNNTNMPRYLHTFNAGDTQEEVDLAQGDNLYGTNRSTCALNIPFSNVEVRYDSTLDGYNTEYTFMIPYSQIWSTTNVLALYNTINYGDSITPLAYIRLKHNSDPDQDQWITVTDSNTSNVVITWIMTVYNGVAAVEE